MKWFFRTVVRDALQQSVAQKINKNNFAHRKPIIPQPGKVRTQVRTISFTTPQLTAESLRAAPTPIMAVVLV